MINLEEQHCRLRIWWIAEKMAPAAWLLHKPFHARLFHIIDITESWNSILTLTTASVAIQNFFRKLQIFDSSFLKNTKRVVLL